MKRIVWAFGWAGVVVWSIVCALAYGLFDLGGRLAARNADAFSSDPETVESIFRVFSFLHSLSTSAILVVWALVSLLILAVPWIFDRMVGSPSRQPALGRRPARFGPMQHGRGQEGVIDLGPDQYSVGPADRAPPGGPVPRVTPRN